MWCFSRLDSVGGLENISHVVTAFFDISRGDGTEYCIPRKTELYYEQFSHWCGVHNQLICFCDEGMGTKIKEYRNKSELFEKTDVIEMYIADLRIQRKRVGGNAV